MNLYSNGFLVKEIDEISKCIYLGVENGSWSLEEDASEIDLAEREYLIRYYNENIDLSWQLDNHVDVCKDFEFAIRYAKACQKEKVKVQILYCQTNRNFPKCEESNLEEILNRFEFIGFDFAYPGGSFYSSVFSDINSKSIKEFSETCINKFGLLNTAEELIKFIELREKLKAELPLGTFEEGEFIVYKLWRYVGLI